MEAIVLSLLCFLQEPGPAPAQGYEATVTVKEAAVRETKRSTSKLVAVLKEKEKVTVLEVDAGMARVRTSAGKEGWVSQRSILDTPTYVNKEQAAGGDPKAGAEAHAYAKGFDPETESKFKSEQNLSKEYGQLDTLERHPLRTSVVERERRLEAFRRKGSLGEFAK